MTDLMSVLDSYPMLLACLTPVAIALPMTLLFSYSGLGVLSGTLQVTGIRTRRAAYNKCARQLALLALVLGWVLLIGSRVWIVFNADSYVPKTRLGLSLEISWGALGIAVITSSLYYALGKALDRHRGIQAALGYLAGLNGILATVAVMGAIRYFTSLDLPQADLPLHELFNFTIFPSPLINAAATILPLCFALPAGAAVLWLIVRRTHDDFGRDYYNSMIPWLCRWAAAACGILTLVMMLSVATDIWGMLQAGTFDLTPDVITNDLLRFLPPILACIICSVTSRSPLPLRNKPWLLLAFLLTMTASYFIYMDATSFVF